MSSELMSGGVAAVMAADARDAAARRGRCSDCQPVPPGGDPVMFPVEGKVIVGYIPHITAISLCAECAEARRSRGWTVIPVAE